MEFCYSYFRVQMHKPLVHDSPCASIYHQGTEASLLELRRFVTLGFGVSGQSKYHWLVATGIAGLSTHGSIIKIQD